MGGETVDVSGPAPSLDRKRLWLAGLFVLFTLVFELFVFRGYLTYVFRRFVPPSSDTVTIVTLSIVILPYVASAFLLFIFVYASLISHRLVSWLYLAFFSLASLYEFSYQRLYGRFSNAQDLGLAFLTTPTQRMDAIGSYTDLYAVIPCVVYAAILVFDRYRTRIRWPQSLAALTLVIAVVVFFHFVTWMKAPRFYFYEAWSNSFAAATRTLMSHAFARASFAQEHRETVENLPRSQEPSNNIVVVLDESVRGDHLSLNGYHRETTPFLDELSARGKLLNWGIAAAASTRSEESFQHILTGLSPTETGEIRKKLESYPTLFQYAKAANYKTYYLDGQQNEYWGGSSTDARYIDVFLGYKFFDPKGGNPLDVDERIAEKANEIISGSSGNFVIIFKRGHHTPYNRNFPVGGEVWRPSLRSFVSERANDNQTIINTYDNGLRYNLESFFRSLVTDYENVPNRTVILYTSDHGQTLHEGGEIYSHGGESVREAMVPLFLIGDPGSRPDTGFKAMHANIFATVLDLMNFPEDLRKHPYAISLIKAKATDTGERYFMTPHVMPGDTFIETNALRKFD